MHSGMIELHVAAEALGIRLVKLFPYDIVRVNQLYDFRRFLQLALTPGTVRPHLGTDTGPEEEHRT